MRNLKLTLSAVFLFALGTASYGQCGFTLTSTINHVRCNGGTSGSVGVTTVGPGAPFSFVWSNNAQTDSVIGLSAGTYTVTVLDVQGCSVIDTFEIQEPDPLFFSTTISNPSCFGKCDGGAVIHATGGTPPYLFNGNSDSVYTGLCGGNKFIILRDNRNCVMTEAIQLVEPGQIQLSVTKNNSVCGTQGGNANVTVTGGVSPYQYHWTNGSTTDQADSLKAGIYMVTVKDDNGCHNFALADISDTDGPSVQLVSQENVSCFDADDGAIDVSITGGNTPYEIQWSSGETTEDIMGLSAGPYELRVAGSNGCVSVSPFLVQQPDEIKIDPTVNKPDCNASNGSISLNVSGGTTPYSYNWSNTAVGPNNNLLNFGVYAVTVTDALSCSDSLIIGVSEKDGPEVHFAEVIDEKCGQLGSIDVEPLGGMPPYDYQWTSGHTTQDITGIEKGLYGVLITDSLNCHGVGGTVVKPAGPQPPDICLVTVDSSSGKNLCVFKKDTNAIGHISSATFFKESTLSGNYYLVGSKSIGNLSQWYDSGSDPWERSWRYKILMVDTCGYLSAESKGHKAMQLVTKAEGNSRVRLIWDAYDGFSYNYHYIHRHHPSTGWEVIDSIASGMITYIDQPPFTDSLSYRVEIKPPAVCNALRAVSHNSSRSNYSKISLPSDTSGSGVASASGMMEVLIFPNPASDKLQMVAIANVGDLFPLQVTLVDMTGRRIPLSPANKGSGQTTMDVSGVAPGNYIIEIIFNDGQITRRKLAIQ